MKFIRSHQIAAGLISIAISAVFLVVGSAWDITIGNNAINNSSDPHTAFLVPLLLPLLGFVVAVYVLNHVDKWHKLLPVFSILIYIACIAYIFLWFSLSDIPF